MCLRGPTVGISFLDVRDPGSAEGVGLVRRACGPRGASRVESVGYAHGEGADKNLGGVARDRDFLLEVGGVFWTGC